MPPKKLQLPPRSLRIERNLAGIPLATLGRGRTGSISNRWISDGEERVATLETSPGELLPSQNHLKVLDAVFNRFAIAAAKGSTGDKVYFRFSDLQRDIGGVNTRNDKIVKEAIRRYHNAVLTLTCSFKKKGVFESHKTILFQALSEKDPKLKTNHLCKESLHWIKLDHELCESLRNNHYTMIDPAAAGRLDSSEYAVFRCLRRYVDTNTCKITVTKLCDAIGLSADKKQSEQIDFVKKRLAGLETAGYVEKWDVADGILTFRTRELNATLKLTRQNSNLQPLSPDFDFDFPTIELTSQEVDESGRIKN